jgi:hypothetical protein
MTNITKMISVQHDVITCVDCRSNKIVNANMSRSQEGTPSTASMKHCASRTEVTAGEQATANEA